MCVRSRSTSAVGRLRIHRAARLSGQGNSISRRPRARPRAMCTAARSALHRKGPRNPRLCDIGVSTKPGYTVVMRTPCGASSLRSASPYTPTAALEAEYAGDAGTPTNADNELTIAIWPARRPIKRGSKGVTVLITPSVFTEMIRRAASVSPAFSTKTGAPPIPALATMRSTGTTESQANSQRSIPAASVNSTGTRTPTNGNTSWQAKAG